MRFQQQPESIQISTDPSSFQFNFKIWILFVVAIVITSFQLVTLRNWVFDSSDPQIQMQQVKESIVEGFRRQEEILREKLGNSAVVERGFSATLENGTLPKVAQTCGRIMDKDREGVREGGKVVWKPKPGKFLLAMCTGGQLSNRIICLRQHMLDAALLQRTLIFPANGLGFDFMKLMDLNQPKLCFGNDTFVTLDDYLENSKKSVLNVSRLICHIHKYQPITFCETVKSQCSNLKVHFASTEVMELRTPGPFFKYPTKKFLQTFSSDEDVIAFGNMFGVGGREHQFLGTGPLNTTESCRDYLIPSKDIIETAKGFVNTFLGTNYIAVHLRRGDFFNHCKHMTKVAKTADELCFLSIQQAAQCLSKRLNDNPGLSVLFLATNGNPREITMLKELLTLFQGKAVPIIQLPEIRDATEWNKLTWTKPILMSGAYKDAAVAALVDKTVCAFAKVFYGTRGSTFSGNIDRLRDWWRMNDCKDAHLCQGMDFDTAPLNFTV